MEIKEFVCVDKFQEEADYFHANWMVIQAESRNKARVKYCKLAGTKYIDCHATIRKK